MANRLAKNGKKVVVAAADTFRAAAVEQLEIWAKRAGADIVKRDEGVDPASVVYDAIKMTKENGADKAKKRKKDFPDYVPEMYKISEQNTDDDFGYIKWTKNKKYLFYSNHKQRNARCGQRSFTSN